MAKNQRIWTRKEERILRKKYPEIGYKVRSLFPNRSKTSVIRKAENMGLSVKFEKPVAKDKPNWYLTAKIGYADIETSGLDAPFSMVYCWSIKERGGKIVSCSVARGDILSGRLDKNVVEKFVKEIVKYNIIITYYGTRFDIPFVRSRALHWRIMFPPYGKIYHMDLYYVVRNKLRLNRNRLENAAEILGIKGKTKLDSQVWMRAHSGDAKALAYILKHNRADVNILEKLHSRLEPFIRGTRTSI